MRHIKRFIQLTSKERSLLLEAIFFLYFSKILLMVRPFRIAIKLFKTKKSDLYTEDYNQIRSIKVAISRANKLAFWKNICIVKSFAARFMLQRRNISSVLYLGLSIQEEKKLIAHAWVVADKMYVTPKGQSNFKEIFSI